MWRQAGEGLAQKTRRTLVIEARESAGVGKSEVFNLKTVRRSFGGDVGGS